MPRAFSSRARLVVVLLTVATTSCALLSSITASTAFGHAGHPHVSYGPPAPDWVWPGAPAARDAHARASFQQELESAPVEVDGACEETVGFEGVGTGCRTEDGLLRLVDEDGIETITHGPDFLEAERDLDPVRTSPYVMAAVRNASADDIACVPATEPHYQLVYAIPADGRDDSATRIPQLRQATYEASAVIDNASRNWDPTAGRRIRVSCDPAGVPSVLNYRLPTTSSADTFTTVKRDIRALFGAGTMSQSRFLVFYDHHLDSFAGVGDIYYDAKPDGNNYNNRGLSTALQDSTDGQAPSWKTLLHEITHNMGAVQTATAGPPAVPGAPDNNNKGHCLDGLDVMCYSEPGQVGTYDPSACPELEYDCGGDSYFNSAPDPASWLDTYWNAAAPYNRYLGPYPAAPDDAAPSVPTGLVGTGHGSFIRVDWDASTDSGSGVHGYRVERLEGLTWTNAGDSWLDVTTVDVAWDSMLPGTSYSLRVRAYDERGNLSDPSAILVVDSAVNTGLVRQHEGPTLAPPTNVVVASSTSGSMTIRWTRSVDDAHLYRIDRVSGGGTSTSWSTTSGIERTVTAGLANSRYVWTVRAMDDDGRTSVPVTVAGWTNVAPDLELPGAPTGVVVTPPTTGTAPTVSWDPSPDAVDYVVSTQPTPGVWSEHAIITDSTLVVTGLPHGVSNPIRIQARDEAGNYSAPTDASFDSPAALDSSPPIAATLSNMTAITSTGFTLHWTGGSDPGGAIAGFRVLVAPAAAPWNLRAVATAGPGATSAVVTGISPGIPYHATIETRDTAGYSSYPGNHYAQTGSGTADTSAPSAPELSSTSTTATSTRLQWTPSTDDTQVTGYRVEQLAPTYRHLGVVTTTALDVDSLDPGATYTFAVSALDAASNETTSMTVVTTVSDVTPPSPPTDLVTGTITTSSIALSWNASPEPDVAGYRVYVDDAPQPGTSDLTTRVVADLAPSTEYAFGVTAVDSHGNESTAVSVTAATATPPDVTPPTSPGQLTATSIGATTATLTWEASFDAGGIEGYRIERLVPDPGLAGTTTGLSLPLASLDDGTEYTYRVIARDLAGLESSSDITFTTLDTTPPAQPGALTIGPVTLNSIQLSWGASTDLNGVDAYEIRRDSALGAVLATVQGTVTTHTLTGLSSDTQYQLYVIATDPTGNRSTARSGAATTLRLAPVTGLTTSVVTQTSVTLSWTASADDAHVTKHLVYRDGGQHPDQSTSTTRSFADLSPDTEYTFTVIAGTATADSLPVQLVVRTAAPDTTPPTPPGALQVGTVTGSSIELSWTASTDASSPITYELRDGSATGTVLTSTTSLGATLSDLDDGVTYHVFLVARDPSNNHSPAQNVQVATPDVTDPNAPTGLAASNIDGVSFALDWNDADDNVGIDHYDVWVDGVKVDSPVSSAAVVEGLDDAVTYDVEVIAVDAANRQSPPSTLSVATLDATPPSEPGNFLAGSASDTSIGLTWVSSTDNVAVTGYRIYQMSPGESNTLVAELGAIATSAVITGLAANTNHTFEIVARDARGLESTRAAASMTTLENTDVTPPTAPAFLMPTNITTGGMRLAWSGSTDAGGIAGYELERLVGSAWTLVAPRTSSLLVDLTGLAAGSSHTFRLRSFDVAGNGSAFATITVSTNVGADVTAPAIPTGPVTASANTSGTVSLDWGASTDDRGTVTGYRVSLLTGAGYILQTVASTNSVTLTGQPIGTTATYAIAAVDPAGNTSTTLVTTVAIPAPAPPPPSPPPPTPPATAVSVSAFTATSTSTKITLAWQQSGTTTTGWRIVEIRGGNVASTREVTSPTATYGPYAPKTSVRFELYSLAGAASSSAVTLDATTAADRVRPTRPGRFRAVSPARGTLALTWFRSRDDVRLRGYEIRLSTRRVKPRIVRLRATATRTRIVRLRSRVPYVVQIRAVDVAGNASAWFTLRTRTR